jgi:Rhs element Vgr protein
MSDERIVPTPAPADLSTVTIMTDGQPINSEYNLVSVTVDRALNKVPAARIMLLDGDVAKEDFEISNSGDFVPGKEIEILAGYHAQESTIFKGIIVQHGLKVRKGKPSYLVLDCRDAAVKMTVGRNNGYYKEMKDAEIIEELIGEYGLTADVEATDVTHPEMVKFNTTDWDFMLSRAEVNGKLVIVDDGTVSLKAPDTSQEPVLSLIHGSTMMEFEAALDARSQLAAAKAGAWDYAAQEIIEEAGDSVDFSEAGNLDAATLAGVIGLKAFCLQHTGQVADAELKSWATGALLKSRLAKIIGRVKCQGFGEIKPGHMLELKGVGDRFNGKAFVAAVRHQIDSRNWVTDIQFGYTARWFAERHRLMERSAAGLLPGVHGLQIGVVTQLESDPDGEDRVLVRMPIVDPEEEGIWARMASPDAGQNRGIFFRPEIGDEVVLGFLNGDPRDPVILGMLHSSAKPAPLTAADDNHEKGLVTRSEIKLVFNDDEISVKLETPNGNTLTVSDQEGAILLEDENGNKITMNADGITLESAADVNITAGGDVNIDGTSINVSASAQFKAEGSAGAEVSSSATAVLKGSLVQIN